MKNEFPGKTQYVCNHFEQDLVMMMMRALIKIPVLPLGQEERRVRRSSVPSAHCLPIDIRGIEIKPLITAYPGLLLGLV